jgi:hypothetical protein
MPLLLPLDVSGFGLRLLQQGEAMTGIEQRIAEVMADHTYENWCALWDCVCGATFPDGSGVDAWSQHVAAVVVETLGLQQERLMPLFGRWFGWKTRWVTSWEKEA